MRRSRFLAPTLATLLVAGSLTATGCSDSGTGDASGDSDGGSGDGDGDGDPGDGDGDGDGNGTVDVGCDADEQCPAGQLCDLPSAECVDGLDCSANPTICAFCSDVSTECGTGTADAYCDEGAGVCRRSKQTCDSCTVDDECGDDAQFENRCIQGFCAKGCGPCPAGFACEGGGCVPVPAAGTCEDAIVCRDGEACPTGQSCSELGVCLTICAADADCETGKICSLDPGPLQGTCLNGCEPGTAQANGQICHSDFRPGPPCPDADCPPEQECQPEGYCAPDGCTSSQQCPIRTYCDVASGECLDGCEVESDCGTFELCEDMQCVQQGCLSKGLSCNLGQFCCGTELYDDPSTCPSGIDDGSCFLAPDPFCRTCEDNDGCADIDNYGEPSNCYELQQQDENGDTVSLGMFCSVGCASNDDCPRGLTCEDLPTQTEGETIKGCLGSLCQAIAEAQSGG